MDSMSSETGINNVPNNSLIDVLKKDALELASGAKEIALESIASAKTTETQNAINETTTGLVDVAATTLKTVGNAIDTNPEMLQVVGEISKDGAEILHEMKPVLQEAVNQVIETGAETTSTLAKSGVNVAANAASAIPGFGSLVSLARMANSITEAGSAAAKGFNSFSQIASKVSADMNNRLDRLRNRTMSQTMTKGMMSGQNRVIIGGARKTRREKKQMEQRISKSLTSFYNPLSINNKTRRSRRNKRSMKKRYN
jgi:hypothetical protein